MSNASKLRLAMWNLQLVVGSNRVGIWLVATCIQFVAITANIFFANAANAQHFSNPVVSYSQEIPLETNVLPSNHVQPASYLSPAPSVLTHPISSDIVPARDWALDISNVQLNLNSTRFPDVAAEKQKLEQAMFALENYLETSPQHKSNWLTFLRWSDLKAQLSKPKPEGAKLFQIEKRFRQNYLGLEYTPFSNVRDALKRYLVALRFNQDSSKSIEFLGNELKKLSEQLQKPEFQKDPATTREISLSISELAQSGQAVDLVQSVRSNFSRANVRLLVSNQYVVQKFSRPVNQENPVNEVILGTQIYGQSQLNGMVTPQLLDSSTGAAIKLVLSGNFTSQSIGYNRSIKFHGRGTGSVAASETVALTNHGLQLQDDSQAGASLGSQIDRIDAKLRIVRRIAAKKAAESKSEADSIAKGRLENRIHTEFHKNVEEQIAQANNKIKTPDFPILKRFGIDMPTRTSWSSPQYLSLLWKLQQGSQLMAPASCPLIVEHSGITLQVHESLVPNITAPVLGGRMIRSEELPAFVAQIESVTGGKSGLKEEKDKEEWAITLEEHNPVELRFDDGLVTFRIRTKYIDRGKQSMDTPSAIEVTYSPVVSNGTIQFQRQGEVKIEFPPKFQRGLKAVTLRGFLKTRFDPLFKETLLDKPARLTENLPADLQGLRLSSVQIDDGWFQLHFQ